MLFRCLDRIWVERFSRILYSLVGIGQNESGLLYELNVKLRAVRSHVNAVYIPKLSLLEVLVCQNTAKPYF